MCVFPPVPWKIDSRIGTRRTADSQFTVFKVEVRQLSFPHQHPERSPLPHDNGKILVHVLRARRFREAEDLQRPPGLTGTVWGITGSVCERRERQ